MAYIALVIGLGVALFFTVGAFWNRTPARRAERIAGFEAAAEAGDEPSAYELLMLYFDESPGMEEYRPLAFKWALKIAEKEEDSGVMLQAADMYYLGHGTEKNDALAAEWYAKALSKDLGLGRAAILPGEAHEYIRKQLEKLKK